jgi:uncharacterized membrane protein YhdT
MALAVKELPWSLLLTLSYPCASLMKHQCHEDSRGSRDIPIILNLGSIWRWVVSLTAYCIGGWVGPTTGLDAVE